MRRMRGREIAMVVTALAAAAGLAAAVSAEPAGPGATRALEFKYTVRAKELPKDGGRLRLWIPVPASDAQQDISDLSIKSPAKYEMREEAEYHDHYAYLEIDPRKQPAPLEIEMSFKAVRRENRVPVR